VVIMQPLNPITFHPDVPKICYIEQTLLPEKFEIYEAKTIKDLVDAILRLGIRGAPALDVLVHAEWHCQH
jgi:methylthioribose-1-phosphate isomerase